MKQKQIAERRQLVLEQYARQIMSLSEMQAWLATKGVEVSRKTVALDYNALGLSSGRPAGRPKGRKVAA